MRQVWGVEPTAQQQQILRAWAGRETKDGKGVQARVTVRSGKGTGKRDQRAIQDLFNGWRIETGRSYAALSMVLAAATGPNGQVYAQIDDLVIGLQQGFFDRTLKARIGPDGARRSNIEYWHRPIDDPGLENLDLVHWGFNLHDHLNMFGEAEVQKILAAAKLALRPGGVLAVSDHVGIEGRNNRKLHRIPITVLRQQIERAGFRITGTSELLANPTDDHSLNVFNDAIYRQTDRILIRAVSNLD